MEEVIKNAEEADLLAFAKTFLGTYGTHGFQSLAKRDTDLLLFYALEHSGVIDSRASNHQVARRLKLTPKRVSNLRRDAWARWAEPSDVRDHLAHTLKACFAAPALERLLKQNRSAWKTDKLIPLLLEHPSDRAEVEQFLKSAGDIPHYAKNPEVVLIPHDQVMALVDFAADGLDKARQALIKKSFATNKKLSELLTQDISKLSAGEVRTVLNTTVATVMEKSTIDLAAKGLSALVLGYLGTP